MVMEMMMPMLNNNIDGGSIVLVYQISCCFMSKLFNYVSYFHCFCFNCAIASSKSADSPSASVDL